MNKYFKLKELGTNAKTEILAGITAFLTMAYIIVVNPAILSAAGIPFEQVFMATVLAAVVGTLVMAFFANYPIAIAPGMGLNVYFTSVVAAQGISYRVVLGAVFVAGVLFLLLTFTRFRELLIETIPSTLKYGITSGIGLFIAFNGLKMANIVVDNPSNLVAFGSLSEPITALSLVGLLTTLALIVRQVRGALFMGMLVTAVLGYLMGMLEVKEIVSLPPTPGIFDFDLGGVFSQGLWAVVFSFLLVTIFDTTGTMIGVTEQAGLTKDGKLPRAKMAFTADAVATTVGAALGTSPSTAYIESSAGVAAGGRSGMTAFVVAILFLIALFFSPLVAAISSLSAITAPALIIVGCFMMGGLAKIKWHEFDEAFPAFIVILTMPLTSSISTGISLGVIAYPLLKLFMGKGKEVPFLIYFFAVLFILQIVFA